MDPRHYVIGEPDCISFLQKCIVAMRFVLGGKNLTARTKIRGSNFSKAYDIVWMLSHLEHVAEKVHTP